MILIYSKLLEYIKNANIIFNFVTFLIYFSKNYLTFYNKIYLIYL